jgi:hypothetical protein
LPPLQKIKLREAQRARGAQGFCSDFIGSLKRTAVSQNQWIEAEILADFAKQNPLDWSG